MNEKGSGLIENLLFISAVLLAVSYLLVVAQTMGKIENYESNHDEIYEKAYS